MYDIIQEKMTSITEKFFTGCKKIKNQKELEEYKKKALEFSNSKCLLRNTEHISGTKFKADWVSKDSDDARVNHFDEHGNRQEFAKEYIITRKGQVYTRNENNGSINKLTLQKQKGCFTLRIKDANGKSIQIQPKQTFIQCTSYFVDYDWKDIMQNRGKTGNVQVDHVLQDNKPDVDIQCLDLVTRTENLNRRDLDPKNTERIMNRAKSQGKPFTITIQENGKDDIVLEATSCPNGVALLEKEGISITQSTISDRLNKQFKTDYMKNGKTIIFKYTEEFREDQKDLHGEIWRTKEEWNRAEEIRKVFENKRDGPPKAISNCGRIKTNTGKITYGFYKSNGVHGEHTYNNVGIHRLVGLAFNDHPEKDPKRQGYTPEKTVVRHINKHELEERGIDVEKKYRRVVIDGEERKVLSNHIDTLEFGTIADNNQDRSRDMMQNAKLNEMNEFEVTPLRKDLPKFNRTFHSIPEFLNFVKEKNIGIKFYKSAVRLVLKGERKSHKYYKFTYVHKSIDPLVT